MTTSETRAPILLVEDTPSLAMVYLEQLKKAGLIAVHVDTGGKALKEIETGSFRVLLLDLQLPDMNGFDILRAIGPDVRTLAVVVITAHGSINRAVEAMQLGARDFLVKPFAEQRFLTTVKNALEHAMLKEQVETIRDDFGREKFFGFIGQSLAMQGIYRAIESVARSRASVFITGESGTGKEICANAIHLAGPRRRQRFVPLNCGAIPKDLIESEIFGHVKGAFTGATADRDGAAALANGGTLFLDEICEMDIRLQAKLLRFLQSGQIQKVGSSRLEPVDVRIICATNRDPWQEVSAQRFREDLFYRLHVVPIHLPPLRERDDDVILIAESFLTSFAKEEGKRFRRYLPEAADLLLAHSWPGNVRELQNVVRNIVVLHDGEEVTVAMLPPSITTAVPPASQQSAAPNPARHSRPAAQLEPGDSPDRPMIGIGRPLRDIERDAIEATIALCGGSIPRAAKLLDVSPSTIYRKRETWQAGSAAADA